MTETRPPNKKQAAVRNALKRSKEYLLCSKNKTDVNHRHGLCRGMSRAFYDLGYMRPPEYREWLFEIGQIRSELDQLLPEKDEAV